MNQFIKRPLPASLLMSNLQFSIKANKVTFNMVDKTLKSTKKIKCI